jgi:hypothetical protein
LGQSLAGPELPGLTAAARSHTGPSNNTSNGNRAAGDLQQDHRRIAAHRWDIYFQRSAQMIFEGMNQGGSSLATATVTPSVHSAPSAKPPPLTRATQRRESFATSLKRE